MNIRELIAARAASDPRLKAVLRKISDGTATLTDTAYYSDVYSDITGKMFSDNVLDLIGAEREEECIDVLRSSYDNINDICAQTQKSLDQAAGINIKPQRAPFPKERVKQIAHSLLDPTVSDSTIKRRANTGVANVSKGFHDSYIKANAKFRSDAGLRVYINRETDGKCCEWCTAMAGRYSYGSEPDDVYRRHDNCGCTVIFENGKQRQDVWSKRSWTAPEVGAGAAEPVRFTPDNAPAGAGEPVRLTKDQAAELQAKNMPKKSGKINNSSIDNSGGSGIIKSDNLKMSADVGFSLGEKHYEVKEDKKQVEDSYKYAKEVLGAGNVKFDKLKNNEVIQPMLEQVNNLKAKHKKSFSQIFVDDTMSDADFAMVSPDLSLHLNAKYMNSSEATADFLSRMKEKKLLPKGLENTEYLITHEYMHFISRSEVDNPRAKVHKVIPDEETRALTAPSKNSKLSKNEYSADSMAMIELGRKERYKGTHWDKWKKIYDYFLG